MSCVESARECNVPECKWQESATTSSSSAKEAESARKEESEDLGRLRKIKLQTFSQLFVDIVWYTII